MTKLNFGQLTKYFRRLWTNYNYSYVYFTTINKKLFSIFENKFITNYKEKKKNKTNAWIRKRYGNDEDNNGNDDDDAVGWDHTRDEGYICSICRMCETL